MNISCLFEGASGALSYAAVTEFPGMKSTIFDLKPVVDVANHFRPSFEECPYRDNVSFVAGDFFEDDFPHADLYSMTSTLQDWDEEKIDLLLSKTFHSLQSGNF